MTSSNSNSKRVAKNTLLLYMRMFFTMGVGLFTSRIVLNTLGVEDYGLYSVVGGIVVLLAFLNGAMSNATQRYLNVALGKDDRKELDKIITSALCLHIVVALIIILIAETFGLYFVNSFMNIPEQRLGIANWVYQLSIFSFVASVISVPFTASIIAHEKMSAFAWMAIFDVSAKLVIVISLTFIEYDKLFIYALLLFIQSCITQYIYFMYCQRNFEECRIKEFSIDKSLLKKMTSFSSWSIVGSLGYLIHTQGIAIIVNIFFGVSVNAAQGISNQVNGIVKQFVSNFLLAFNPQVVKTYAAGELSEMHKLVLRGCKVACLMVAFFVVPLILEAPTILKLWLGFVPNYAVIFVRLILLLTLFDAFTGLLASAKGATGDIKSYQIVLTTIGLTHLPLVWICFKLGCEPYWAQIVYLFIIIALQIVRIWFVCNAVKLSIIYFYKEVILRCSIVILSATILPLYMHFALPNCTLSSMAVCATSVILLILFSLGIGFNKNEREHLIKIITNKIKRKHNGSQINC